MKSILNKVMDETVLIPPLNFSVLIAPTWFNRIGQEFQKLNEMYGINYEFESYDSFLKSMIKLDNYTSGMPSNKVSEIDPSIVAKEDESSEEPAF